MPTDIFDEVAAPTATRDVFDEIAESQAPDLSKVKAQPWQEPGIDQGPYGGYTPGTPGYEQHKREAAELFESLGEPPVRIPRIQGRTTLGKLAAAPVNVASGLIEGAITPAMVPAIAAGGSALGGAVVKGLFSGLAAKSAGEALGKASVSKDVQDVAEGVLGAGVAPWIALTHTLPERPTATPKAPPLDYKPAFFSAMKQLEAKIGEKDAAAFMENIGNLIPEGSGWKGMAEAVQKRLAEPTPAEVVANNRPAIKTMPDASGKTEVLPAETKPDGTYETHDEVIKKEGLTTADIDKREFVDQTGAEKPREQTAQELAAVGATTKVPGEAHSTDVNKVAEEAKITEPERIVSTAWKMNDGSIVTGKNPNTIHDSILSQLEETAASNDTRIGETPGFLTSTGRFVDADEAAQISQTGLKRLGAEHLTKTGNLSKKNIELQKQFDAEDAAKRGQSAEPPKPPPPVTGEAQPSSVRGTISFESLDEPSGKWEPREHPYIISKSTIPGSKPWRMTVFGGPKDAPVPIGHIELDSPTVLPTRRLQDLAEQLGRYTRKYSITDYKISGENYFHKPAESPQGAPAGTQPSSAPPETAAQAGRAEGAGVAAPSQPAISQAKPVVEEAQGAARKADLSAVEEWNKSAALREKADKTPPGFYTIEPLTDKDVAAMSNETLADRFKETIRTMREVQGKHGDDAAADMAKDATYRLDAGTLYREALKRGLTKRNPAIESYLGEQKALPEPPPPPKAEGGKGELRAPRDMTAQEALNEFRALGEEDSKLIREQSDLAAALLADQGKTTKAAKSRIEKSKSRYAETQTRRNEIAQRRNAVKFKAQQGIAPEPTPAPAAAKVEAEVQRVAATEGQRPAKEVKSELVSRLEKAIEDAPEIGESSGKVTIEIPGDGSFTVWNNKRDLKVLLDRANKIDVRETAPVRKIPGERGNIDFDKEADKAIGLYKTPEDAYRTVKRQIASLEDGEAIQKAEKLLEAIYEKTQASLFGRNADIAKENAAEKASLVEDLTKQLDKLKKAKKPDKRRVTELESLIADYSKTQKIFERSSTEYSAEELRLRKELGLDEGIEQPTPPAAGVDTGALGAVGMGGAKPGELSQPGDYVSNMFAAIDKDRAERGLPPMAQTVPHTWKQASNEAMAMMRKNPDWISNLLAEVKNKTRTLSDTEVAGMVYQRAKWKAELNNAYTRINRAFEDGRTEDMAADKVFASTMEDRLVEMDEAVGRGGTGSSAGRSLNAQKMAVDDDMNLVSMVLEKQAALGRKLTDAERANLQKIADEYKAKSDALEKHLADKDRLLSEAEAARRLAEAKAQAAPTFDKRILAHAESIVRKMEAAGDAAKQRILARLKSPGAMSGPLDPTLIDDLAIWGSGKIARLSLDSAKFADAAIREFGEAIRDYLPAVWQKANSLIDSLKAPEAVKRVFKERATLGEIKTATAQSIADKVAKGEKDKISWYVNNLARALVKSGITEREPLIDAVHEVLKEAMPDITRRQTMDAISGYGDFKQLSKDAITVQLRGMKGEMQQLAKLEDMAAGKPPLKSGVERRTPTEAERKLIKEVNDAKFKFQVPADDPATQLQSALDTLKTTLRNRITDYEDRLARKDFAPRPRREVQLDQIAQRLKAESLRVSKRYKEALTADRLKNRTSWEKFMDWGTKFRRFGVLSSPVVIPKLISAGAQRLLSLPLEELAGTLERRIPGVSEVAKRAPLEGGGANLKAELTGWKEAYMKGLRDAYNVLKTGHTDLDVLYGKASESYTGEFEFGSRLLAIPGRIHGMIKAPIKRAVFERAVDRLGQFYAKQGLDLTDDVVKARIAVEAYKAGNRAIFLNDNRVASKISAWISEWKDKETGKIAFGGKVWSTAGRMLLPIVRVPTNIVAETMQYAGGLVSAPIRIGIALRKGVEQLNDRPEYADQIMRELKKGSIGGAVLLLGYLNADKVGGYYQPGQKRDPKDLKAGTIRVFGVDVPSYLLHNPLLETLQVGATIRRVADAKLRKKDQAPQGLPAGMMAAALGMSEQVPFVREMSEMDKVRNPYTRMGWLDEMAKSVAIPAVIQKTAEWTDTGVKRRPTNLPQHLEMGIPGLRQNVPVDTRKPR